MGRGGIKWAKVAENLGRELAALGQKFQRADGSGSKFRQRAGRTGRTLGLNW